VARQSRRARLQSGARKREPNIPRHLLERVNATTLDTPVIDATENVAEIPPEVAAATEPAPILERKYRDLTPVAARMGGVAKTAPAIGKPAPAASKWATTDYGYIVDDLKHIFIAAGIIIVFLVVVALIKG
jgi:hypothetical protein